MKHNKNTYEIAICTNGRNIAATIINDSAMKTRGERDERGTLVRLIEKYAVRCRAGEFGNGRSRGFRNFSSLFRAVRSPFSAFV